MFVYELPADVDDALCAILDDADSWMHIAKYLEMSSNDMSLCRQAGHQGSSATRQILRIWASRGFAVTRLYKLLAIVKQRRAMLLLETFVPEELREAHTPIVVAPSSPSTSRPTASSVSVHQTASIARHDSMPSHTTQSGISHKSSVTDVLQNTLSVRYGELHAATDGFHADNVIGKGGYGVVYRGEWLHSVVAVKRIIGRKAETSPDEERERVRQSLIEMKTLSFYRHDNVLALYGYSLDGPEPCIVYQYMAGRSLEDRLLGKYSLGRLSWADRHAIMVGTGRGLHFLHSGTEQALIHGDIKSANILLDAHLTPKLGDFGLSRLGKMQLSEDAPPMIASHIRGTLAYLPPEFIRNRHLSVKLDMFGVGVVFYEVGTGLRAYSNTRTPESLVAYVHGTVETKTLMDVHEEVEGEGGTTFATLMRAGDACSATEASCRPTAHEVIAMLLEK